MPVYVYVCKTCKVSWEKHMSIKTFESLPAEQRCPECSRPLVRKFSFGKKIDFTPHYSSALGKYVNTKREQTETLQRLEDEHASKLGYQPSYKLYDPRELEYTTTEDGMDETRRRQVKTGQLEVRKWH